MIVHLVDGTYELFRHFYGQRRFNNGQDKPFGAVAGVLNTVLEMAEGGAEHIGVATDHVMSRSVIGFGPGTRPDRASSQHFSRSSIRSRRRLPRWASLSGP